MTLSSAPHGPDTPGGTSIAAVYIVKDEEAVLEASLRAVAPFVDEVVVYDTGSTDATRDVARSCGALVVEGYWDDDFGAARNRAIAHASAEWVFVLDADEVASGEPAEVRRLLQSRPQDYWSVDVFSPHRRGGGAGEHSKGARVFRRSAGRYAGALHEQVVSTRTGLRLHRTPETVPLLLTHLGYVPDVVQARDKHRRNADIAQRAVDGLPGNGLDPAMAWCNLGRSLAAAGEDEKALAALARMTEHTRDPQALVLAGRAAVPAAARLKRRKEGRGWLKVLAAAGEAPGRVHQLAAVLDLAAGDTGGALRELRSACDGTDPWGVPYDAREARLVAAQVEARHGDGARAVAELRDVLRTGYPEISLEGVLAVLAPAEADYAVVVPDVDEAFVERSLRESLSIDPQHGDRWLSALHDGGRSTQRVTLAGAVLAVHLPLPRMLVWSLRVREMGLTERCPLRRAAADAARPATERCLLLAVLGDVLGDAAAPEAFAQAWGELADDEERLEVARTVDAWIPSAV
ncbi:tetratricopeptide repeat-containing glycosyltransferase family 2 protein [Kineococcus rubinsiae]|uniref:tetratricopeptide repeat-containing glycosyltransferase family 2 protein n=1 Tax=Kineococcus rubinsiae TaxID=2609562 RepID=UPI001AD8E418|nr:glycosyltransferase family 2 protein [Kineococcus rubinsiae]NIZ93480.1 glycosyltransferase [Kineococcus rubinsiae]